MIASENHETRWLATLPILVVDDYAEMRSTIRGMLQVMGCRDVAEDDGRNALSLLRERCFALVVCDLYMQPVSGLQLLRWVRHEPHLAEIPFIMITAAATEESVAAAKRLGVDAYVVKPFTFATLRQRVIEVLRRRQEPERIAAAAQSEAAAELRSGIAVLMRMIEARLAAAELALDDQALLLLRSYLARATELGLERHHYASFTALCTALRATLSDEPAAAPSVSTSRAGRRELRQHPRFISPALQVMVQGRTYHTADWSVGGFAICGYGGTLAPGREIDAAIQLDSAEPRGLLLRDNIKVVRHIAATGRLSARYAPNSWTSLKVMEQLIHRRIGATEGGVAA